MAKALDFGKEGEDLAIEYLESQGYHILERNWRYQKAEIDILAVKEGVLAVVEVKTRATDFFGKPQDFVDKKKVGLLVKAVDAYVIQRDLDLEVRFDIIGIVGKGACASLEHLQDAFYYFDL